MSGFDDEENFIAQDFHTLVFDAQMNELEEEEKRRSEEREKALELAKRHNPSSMSLLHIAGLRSQKELDKEQLEKTVADEEKVKQEDRQRKDEEESRLVTRFPAPNITVR